MKPFNPKLTFFLALLFVLLPQIVSASWITLYDNYGWMRDWNDKSHISGNDLLVSSHLRLGVSGFLLNKSGNYTFDFSPWEPRYVKEPLNSSIRIFRGCGGILPFSPPQCREGEELTKGQDFRDEKVDQDNWEQKEHKIVIFQNASDGWVDYDVFIQYILKDFVQRKGFSAEHYFSLRRFCRSYGGEENKNKCPDGNAFTQNVFLTNPKYKLTEYPSYAKTSIEIGESESIYLEGSNNAYTIWFLNTSENEILYPLIWATIGAVIGFFLGLIPWLIDRKSKTRMLLFKQK